MEKKKVLVRDDKGFFLKIFTQDLKDEFKVIQNAFFNDNQISAKDINYFIHVVYDKAGFIEFLKLNKTGTNILVCLFNKKLPDTPCFFEEISNTIKLKEYKTGQTILADLKLYFKNTSKFKDQINNKWCSSSYIINKKFQDYNKALFLYI